MKDKFLANLKWLTPLPGDFREQVRAIDQTTGSLGTQLQFLASHSLNQNQLLMLSKKSKQLTESGSDLSPLSPVNLGIVSNGSTDFLAPAIQASALRHGLLLQTLEAPFDQVIQTALTPGEEWLSFEPDLILIAIDFAALFEERWISVSTDAEQSVKRALNYVDQVRNGFKANLASQCILQTITRHPEPLFGSYDFQLPGTERSLVYEFNRGLLERISGSNDLLLDTAGLAELVGLANWHDPTMWFKAKLPFSQSLVPLYADHVARLVASSRGKSRKCLVLDLDNTLWGGVIGDDGLEGIKLGQGDTVGEAHMEVQKAALRLHDRGIVLAVSSKNNEDVARSAFESHPDMILRERHIAVFQANWSDKGSNIKAIANALNLGTDSLVFLDDNPAERALVRKALPEVAVPELPADPAHYPFVLFAGGYFESIAFSEEDGERPAYYKANAERIESLEKAISIDEYLASLEMRLQIIPFDEIGRPRITQLINKSNQFNLTTTRYTTEQVSQFERSDDFLTVQARLVDSFGDNGMISVIIVLKGDSQWDIDTWLMSCRVLGRKIETALLQAIVESARAAGISSIVGKYQPSGRNQIVSDHYEKLGFHKTACDDDGRTIWELSVPGYQNEDLPFTIKSSLSE